MSVKEIPLWQFEQARKVQISLLPKTIPNWNGLSFAYEYHSLDPIGGDYLDFFDIKENKKGLLIADVSGHGVPAALITAMAKMSFSNHARHSDSPKEILSRVNEDIFQLLGDSGLYITAFFLIIDQDLNVCYTSAGHPALIYYDNENNSFQTLSTRGLFIGAFEDAWESYEEKKIKLKPGDRLVLYTDGIVESRNHEGEQYGVQRVEDTVTFSSALPPDKLSKMIINDVRTYCKDAELTDDMSIVVMEVALNLKKFHEHYRLGKTYLDAKDSRWLKEYMEAYEYNPDYYELAFNLGRYYLKEGQYQEASDCFKKLLSNNIPDPNVHFYMAQIYIQEKKYIKAIALLKDVVKDFPDFKEALGNLGFCYFSIRQYDKALDIYEQLTAKYPYKKYYQQVRLFVEQQIKEKESNTNA